MKRVHPFHMRHFARAVKGVDLKSTAETRVGSSPAGDESYYFVVLPVCVCLQVKLCDMTRRFLFSLVWFSVL